MNLSFRDCEARLPEDIQQVNSVASNYGVQLAPNEAYLDGDWNTRGYSVYKNSDLIKSDLSPFLGECAALLLFSCYDIYDAVGISGWLVRHFLVISSSCWYQKHSSAKRTNYYSHCKGAAIKAKRREIWERTFHLDWSKWDTMDYQSPYNWRTVGY